MKYFFIICLTLIGTTKAWTQEARNLESASLAVEKMLDQDGKASINEFMAQYMPSQTDKEAVASKINGIRNELKGIRDGISLMVDPEGAILAFSAQGVTKRLRILYNNQTNEITDMLILPPEEELEIDIDNLDAVVDLMQEQQMAGLFYLKSQDEVKILQPFGLANPATNLPNSRETIFAIGSRPIDFTVASILLLDQQGKLSLEDPITKFIDQVPADKQDIRLKHLMSGRSGFPDFFHNDNDWDADLQWISRDEAIDRLMKQKLLFTPGEGRAHSHGAFGLLAAIIEMVSGKSYMEFLHENFFDPARMKQTGEYGDRKNFEIKDFAVGGGPQFVGLPNIPPNWGPTSWLIKGSGGMYSTLDDLIKFYDYIRNGGVLDEQHAQHFKGESVQLDGSDRGFELFSVSSPARGELYLFLNKPGDGPERRKIFRALEALLLM